MQAADSAISAEKIAALLATVRRFEHSLPGVTKAAIEVAEDVANQRLGYREGNVVVGALGVALKGYRHQIDGLMMFARLTAEEKAALADVIGMPIPKALGQQPTD